jgi:hypothetical protein
MPYLLVRHKVRDFATWKPQFEAHETARQGLGIRQKLLLRNADDPQELVVLMEADDLAKARQFSQSPDLREVMEKAGVIDRPDVYFLESAG